ncbi:MAG: fructose bisphosphate aldolase [Rhodobacteraceae bacterium]|nr:fructose bisphosphate aldolase [Paracoccaceae bacterium]
MNANERLQRFSESQGFVAALDQSGGSTPKALELYGISGNEYADAGEMMDLMHAMRTRIVTSPEFNGDKVLGAILFERTMDSEIGGMPAADYLWNERRVLPFLKIDDGLEEEECGINLMRPITNLEDKLRHACEKNIFGTKMRSVIHEAEESGVARIVDQQFELAQAILQFGLVPIVEPEISIHCRAKAACEDLLRDALLRHLDALPEGADVALKLTLPETSDQYQTVIAHPRVLRVTALSGGYDRVEACRRLALNNGMIASFSRALAEGLDRSMSDAEFNRALGASIDAIHKASSS